MTDPHVPRCICGEIAVIGKRDLVTDQIVWRCSQDERHDPVCGREREKRTRE